MSYTVPPAAAAPRPRPGTVTAASYLLYVAAAVEVVSAIVAVSTIGAQRKAMEQAYANYPELKDAVPGITVGIGIGTAVFALLFAAAFVVLGILDGKGKNPARIVTWVLGGLAVCCFGGGLLVNASGSSGMFGGGNTTNAPDPAEVQRILNENLPSWYGPVRTALALLSLLSIIIAIILLAMPASNAYFRKPEPTFEPPTYPTVS